jgi:hypothetical protein
MFKFKKDFTLLGGIEAFNDTATDDEHRTHTGNDEVFDMGLVIV